MRLDVCASSNSGRGYLRRYKTSITQNTLDVSSVFVFLAEFEPLGSDARERTPRKASLSYTIAVWVSNVKVYLIFANGTGVGIA